MKLMVESITKGVLLGFCIAAPVGPIGTLVLKQSLRQGRVAGLASGLGAALADMSYGFLAAAGVRLAAGYARPIAILGGSFLLWLAWKSWREAPVENIAVTKSEDLSHSVATTFVLTLSNPMTILSFAAMIASTGVDAPIYFVAGVFLGSMLWWTLLSTAAAWLSAFVEVRGIVLNRIAAITLGAFGVWAIVGKGLR
jgi:putative LysE/RhtB family amino acid efflux pump